MTSLPLIAVDIGNARIKLGLFVDECAANMLPEPIRTLSLDNASPDFARIEPWLGDAVDASHKATWWISSVNRPAATRLIDWLRTTRPNERITMLSCGDLPLAISLGQPDRIGIDRLVDAIAVNHVRESGRPAVVVDVGSAITVDLVSSKGEFLGGAILPGLEMSARGMHEFTDLLPLVSTFDLSEPPPALGDSTIAAMQSGLFWGAVGAVRELVARLQETAGGKAQIFLTGGAGRAVAELLGDQTCYAPHLTLAGIALAAKRL